jgi:hypothetical protein
MQFITREESIVWRSACRVLLACIAVGATTPVFGNSAEDKQAIRQLAQQYETGWNTHDMDLLGRMRTQRCLLEQPIDKIGFAV